MEYVIWLIAGTILVVPLLGYEYGKDARENLRIFGNGLLVAAGIYVVFAGIHRNLDWLVIEMLGVAAFFTFYWLATIYSSWQLCDGNWGAEVLPLN